MLVTIFMVVIMFGFMYFAMIRPQKKATTSTDEDAF